MTVRAIRGSVFHCLADPGEHADPAASEALEDGLVVVQEGRIAAIGPANDLLPALPADAVVDDHRGRFVLPGLIDCHVHFPQLDIIASYGEQLLDWLNRYAYPAEMRFADPAYARETAGAFLDELLANGTTTALVFGTVHAHSADAIFEAAEARNMRLIAGKVLMDRGCPEELRDSAESGYSDSAELIARWHGHDRLGYAITPRFALTSSPEQLEAAGKLAAEHPDTWVHTHLAENQEEIDEIARLFPDCRSYLDVYRRFGLVRERSVFAHCLHMDDEDRSVMHRHGAAAAFCPTSNLFLGSGLFDLHAMRGADVRCGLGTDVGGGTSLSLLRTAAEAYKVLHLRGQSLPAERAIWLATLGAAEALYLDDKIGSFETGKEADVVVLEPAAATITSRRVAAADTIAEKLFALLTLGDDRNVAATYVLGEPVA